VGISTGLKAAYLMQEGADSSIAYDDSKQGHDIPLTNVTLDGDTGLDVDANGKIGLLDNTDDAVVDSEAGTIIMRFNSHTSFGNGQQNLLLGVVRENEGDFYLLKNVNNMYFLLRDDTATHFITVVSAQVPNYQSGTTIAVQWDRSGVIYDSKNMAFNIDGSYVVPNASARADSWNSFNLIDSVGVLNDPLTTNFKADGICNYKYYFNTVKTEAELAAIAANHYIILDDYFGSSAGSKINKGKGKGL